MQEIIFKKNRFSDSALEMLKLAQYIASVLGEEKAHCSHLLAAVTYLAPEAVEDVLGKNIADWVDRYKIDWEMLRETGKATRYADELCALLIDTTDEAPLAFIRNFFPDRIIGAAELAFILFKEATEEIVDIIAQYNITNDSNEFSNQLCVNYLACCDRYAGKTPRERLRSCIEMGKKFSAFMNSRITGQGEAIEALTTSLVNFWYGGNKQKPLPVLLFSKPGGGISFFAQTMQEAFVELGIQKRVYPALDLSCFTHDAAADSELLGEDKSYRGAHPGKIYDLSQENRRGTLVFENVQFGCDSAKRILSALTQNNAYDKYVQANINLPFNILVFTMTLEESQYDFLMENGTETLDAQQLTALLRKTNKDGCKEELSLINAVQDFICLKELEHEHLREMIQTELTLLENHLQNEYQVAFSCSCRDELMELLLQSAPHKVTPKELVAIMKKHFSGIAKSVVHYPDAVKIKIQCGQLPDYPHEMSRRTIRGDYLTFKKCESCDGETYICSFEDICYATQQAVDCGAYRIERPKNVSLDDIVGLDSLKAELQDALDYITGKYKKSNIPPPALGYILTGEPGCGKTATITALASSCDIPVFFANSAVFSDAQKINDLFTKARMMSPCIIVMEELNSIGKSDQPWRVDAINTLLSHMDGVEESSKLLVLGSTNYVDQIEAALRRPGRFSRVVQVGLPEAEARDLFIRKFEDKYSFELAEKDRKFLVSLTEGKTIAVMKGVLEHALRTSIRTGTCLNSAQLETAYDHIVSKEVKNKTRTIGFSGVDER